MRLGRPTTAHSIIVYLRIDANSPTSLILLACRGELPPPRAG